MHLGIFAKTFPRPNLEQTLDAVVAHELTHIQFNMSRMGLPTLPDKIDEGSCVWIAQMLAERGLTMAAISGTFNMVDPDEGRLESNLRRLEALAAACRWLDTRIITLCTGSLDPRDMWKAHPENARKSTWERLVETMRQAVKIADRHEVTLAFEPECNNVVSSVMRARLLLDEVDSPWLKVVIDPANLLQFDDLNRLREIMTEANRYLLSFKGTTASRSEKGQFVAILDEAFDWLGPEIVLAHAKTPPRIEKAFDFDEMEAGIRASRSLRGNRPEKLMAKLETDEGRQELRHHYCCHIFFQPYLTGLMNVGFRGALIMHGLKEDEVRLRTSFLRETLESLSSKD